MGISFAGGIVTLGESVLVALAVPFMVIALPVVLLARLVQRGWRTRLHSSSDGARDT